MLLFSKIRFKINSDLLFDEKIVYKVQIKSDFKHKTKRYFKKVNFKHKSDLI